MSDELIFNGTNFADFNTYFDGSKSFLTPEKDVEFVDVPGRSGTLSFDNHRFHDVIVPYPCFIKSNFLQNFRALENYLYAQTGFQRLECSKEPGHYRMAQFVSVIEPETTAFNKAGFFTINFRCHPQRWLVSGEGIYAITSGSAIDNPTRFESYPVLRVEGSGSLMLSNITITIAENDFEYIDIDCETMDAYYYSNNANSFVSFNTDSRIVLYPGSTGITFSGLTSVQIQPRWYEV